MKKLFLTWHRRIAILVAVPVLLWSISGVFHPMMANWLKPSIAKKIPPQLELNLSGVLPPSQVLASLPEISHFKLISIDQKPAYLAITPDGAQHYFDAQTASPLTKGAEDYSEQLARHYLDDSHSKLLSIEKIQQFNSTYGYINRLLPVYRVKLDRADGLEAVVDPRTGKLASYDSPSKRILSTGFDWFHRWSFLGDRHSYSRIIPMTLVSLLSLFVGLSGVVNLLLFRNKKKKDKKQKRKLSKARYFHRLFGTIALLFYFLFGLSGIYHLAFKFDSEDATGWSSKQTISTQKLIAPVSTMSDQVHQPIKSLTLAIVDDQPYYRLGLHDKKQPALSEYVPAHSAKQNSVDDQFYAEQLALEFSGYQRSDISKSESITRFRNDYGFIFKRLPVWRVHFDNQTYWHYTVDTTDAHMAMRTSTASLAESLTFINLHKFHFLDPISKKLRDYVSAIAALLICSVTLFGILLVIQRRRKKN